MICDQSLMGFVLIMDGNGHATIKRRADYFLLGLVSNIIAKIVP